MASKLNLKIDAFRRANSHDDTDFTIKLGGYSWKVHSDLLAKKSGYFHVLCNGGFEEATTRLVELHDHNPWDFARFLQHVYIGSYEFQESRKSTILSLDKIMHQGKSKGQGDWTEKDERSKLETLLAMFHLANYFDVSDLRDLTACALVESVTFVDNHIWTEEKQGTFSFEKSAEHFPVVFETVSPFFAQSAKLERLETRMAQFLAAAKILLIRQNNTQILPILTLRPKDTPSKDSVLHKLLDKIKACIDGNPSFAKAYAKAMEEVVDKALLCQNWYVPKLKSFMPTSFEPYDPNKFW